jgi:hypothetical protein
MPPCIGYWWRFGGLRRRVQNEKNPSELGRCPVIFILIFKIKEIK